MTPYKEQIFFLSLLVIYYMQGMLYSTGSIISQVSLGLMMAVSVYYLGKTLLQKKKNIFSKMLFMLIVINLLYFIFFPANRVELIKPGSNYSQIKAVIFALLPFYVFYQLSKQRKISDNILYVFTLIFFILFSIRFFYEQAILLSESVSGEVVNNAAYNFVFLCPLILFMLKKNKIISLILYSVAMFFIISGNKRGAIVCFSTFSFIYFYSFLKTLSKENIKRPMRKLLLVIVSTVALGLTINWGYKYFSSNDYLMKRLEATLDGNTSGRDAIVSGILDYYTSANIGNQLFGFGFNSSIAITGNYAHNDWLELLTLGGLFAVLVYFIMFLSLYRHTFKRKGYSIDKMLAISIFVLWAEVTLFSMGYSNMMIVFCLIILGAQMGENRHIEENIKGSTQK